MYRLKLSLFIACLSLTLSAPFSTASAQQQQQPIQPTTQQGGEAFRAIAPNPLAPRPFNLATPYTTTLPNGLRVVFVEDKRFPLVNFRLAFRTGDTSEPKELRGLNDIMTQMLTEGTDKRTSKQIADEIARLGGSLGASSNPDYTVVSASGLSNFAGEFLDLMADITLRPTFPQGEFDLTKRNAKQSLVVGRGRSAFLSNERLARVLYGETPYGTISATPESLERMTRDALVQFHKQTFTPANAVLVVVGDMRREQLMKLVSDKLGAWKGEASAKDVVAAPPAHTARTIYIVDRPGSAQSSIAVANPAITRNSPDYFPVFVMNTILGGGINSRLSKNIRENKGYTYDVRSTPETRRYAGSFRATTDVRTEVTGAAVKELFSEMERIANEPITDQELRDTKAYITGLFPLRLETQEGLTEQLVQIEMYGLPADTLQTYRDRINAVTKEDVQRVARSYVSPAKSAIVIVGDAAKITDQLKPYSQSFEYYDAAGNRKEGVTTSTTSTATVGAQGTTTTTNVTAATPANGSLVGNWTLEVQLPNGATLPATLMIKEDAGKLTGTVSSAMGDATLTNITINGAAFDGAMSLTMQGQAMDGKMSGRVEADKISGQLELPGTPAIAFVGTRTK